MMRILTGLITLILSVPLWAGEAADQATANVTSPPTGQTLAQPVSGSGILEMTLGLVFVIILIFVIAWFVKRFSVFHPISHDQLRVIAGIHLGQREKILLVQVGEQQLLVGLTATDIRTLHVLENPLQVQDNKSIKNSEFARKLAGMMDNWKGKS